MVLETDTPKNEPDYPNAPESTAFVAASTSLAIVAVVAATRNKRNPSPQNRQAKHMFRGNHPTRVDEKGRLKVPAEFKRVIDEKYAQKFYITSLDGIVAQVYPFEEWERIEQKLAALSTYNPTKKKFLKRTNYYGQVVEMDGQGRLLVPQILREAAQIRGEVAVLGNLTYLEVRNMEALDKEIKEQPSRMTTPRRSTNWASSGNGFGFNKHPRAGWAWGGWPCPGSFKRSDRFSSRKAWRNLSGCHGGLGRAQLRNRKTPRRTGTFDWLR